MELQQNEYGREGTCFCNLVNAEIEFELCDDETPEAYGEKCAEAVGNMPPELIRDILEAAKRYCLFFTNLCRESAGEQFDPDEFPPVTEDTPAEEMRKYFSISGVCVDDPDDPAQIGYRLSGECDWEIEHGIEADILDGKLVYLGAFEMNSPWAEPDPDNEWNFANKN
ncbi:MAG: hypothetical protein IK130_09780 [Oscillospiraceae bacterium]|nr:hypothetical protein [Oscillospiraceae bacterium]